MEGQPHQKPSKPIKSKPSREPIAELAPTQKVISSSSARGARGKPAPKQTLEQATAKKVTELSNQQKVVALVLMFSAHLVGG